LLRGQGLPHDFPEFYARKGFGADLPDRCNRQLHRRRQPGEFRAKLDFICTSAEAFDCLVTVMQEKF
jgi:hypothetical protein